MRSQHGAAGALILVVLALMMVAIIALSALTRTSDIASERDATTARIAAAVAALDNFAGAAMRLPCPADPGLDTGEEVTATPSSCSFPAGTLPWKTLGIRREDAFDAWSLKLSYRVHTGPGSLTQPGGVSMVNCDTLDAFPGGLTADGANNSGRLCNPDANTANRNTTQALFLANKGLQLTEFGTARNDVAYVVLSHGSTGLGGWTSSGVQRDLPGGGGVERDHTTATGPFVMQAFSDLETKSDSNAHFDDVLAFRTLSEVVKRANLAARNWPDTILASITFDQPTLTAALGSAPNPDTGQVTISFNNATVSAFDSGGDQNISFDNAGTDAIGGVSGSAGLTSSLGEGLRIDLAEKARQLAFTLDDFGAQLVIAGTLFRVERVEVKFYDVVAGTATLVRTDTLEGCRADGGLASFSIDAAVDFNRVELRSLVTTNTFTFPPSVFELAAVRTCAPAVACQSPLYLAANACP